MSTKYSPTPATPLPPLSLEFQSPSWLRWLYLPLWGAALGAVGCSGLDPLQAGLLIIAVTGYLYLCRQRARPRRGRLAFDGCRWRLEATADSCPLELAAATVWPWLLVLHLRAAVPGGRASALTLLPGSLAPPDWRRLRLYLRHYPVSAAQPAADGV